MKKNYFLKIAFLMLMTLTTTLRAQTTLSKGDIAIVGYSTPDDSFAFVTFVELQTGTEIYFTDEEADGDFTIGLGEGHLLYTAPSVISAGTVITGNTSAANFTVASSSWAPGNSGDGVIAYQGNSVGNVTTFLHAVGEDSGDMGTFPTNTLSTNEYLLFGSDDGNYTGTTTGTAASLFSAINTLSGNWTVGGALSLDAPSSFTVAPQVNPTITFDNATSSETETDATFSTSGIPITLTNYDADVTVTATVNGSSTAEVGDYTIDLTPLVFDANETLNIPLSINDDGDSDDETIIIEFTVTSGTADLSTSTHTVTITDDDLPQIIISEIMYNTPSTDDEWIEVYNGNGVDVDISNWTVVYSGGIFTFPGSTTITDGDYLTIALGSNGDGTYNNDNPFTPDFNNLTSSPSNANVKDTNDTNNLGNSSGTITLKSVSGTSIDLVEYDQGDVSSTDGNGLSYEIVDTASDNSNTSTNWQGSALNGGSPGRLSSTTWSGDTNNDWSTSSNWSNGIPVATSDILIPASLTNYPTASGVVTVNSVMINSGASLIAQSAFAGNITYNRTLPTTNWYLISSPVVGQDKDAFVTASGFATGSIGSNVGFADYNNTTEAWSYYQSGTSGSGAFTQGQGHSVKLASAGDVVFTGTFNDADASIGVTNNANGFNLIGNPYLASVSVSELLNNNGSLLSESTVWLWDQSLDSYVQKNLVADLEIAPGQAFFISANTAGDFGITESMQSHSADTFQRTVAKPEVELSLSNGKASRTASIYYIDGATTGFDNGYDSSIFGGFDNDFSLYTHAVANGTGRNLGIQSLPKAEYQNMIIPVGVIAESGSSLEFSASSENLPEGIKIYLEDRQENTFIRLDALNASYKLTTESAINGVGRFYLHTNQSVLNINDVTLDNVSVFRVNNSLRIVGLQQGRASVKLFNVLGRQVLNTAFESNGTKDISLPSLAKGVYIVHLETVEGALNKKIILE